MRERMRLDVYGLGAGDARRADLGAVDSAGPGWTITRDVLGDEPEAVGVVGPRSYGDAPTDAKALPIRFRLLDDDGEVYYEGRMNEAAMDAFGYSDEDPLHGFGAPNAGCTSLQYFTSGEAYRGGVRVGWVTL